MCPATFSTAATDRRNILLVVSDDQDYCLYGFMAGVCEQKDASGWVTCTSETTCRARQLGRCVASAAVPTPDAELPLRLNDLTCRNRQPKRRDKKQPPACDPADSREDRLDRSRLRLSREGAPCGGTDPAARPGMFTPRLDRLAAQAAVFPRAYVVGLTCKNSRRGMLTGRHIRHQQWVWMEGTGRKECERADASQPTEGCRAAADCMVSSGEPARACETLHTIAWWLGPERAAADPASVNLPAGGAEYKRFAFGKTEVVSPSRAGVVVGGGGFEAKPASKVGRGVGKIKCEHKLVTDPAVVDLCKTAFTTDDPEAIGSFPTVQSFDIKANGVEPIVEAINTTMEELTDAAGNQLDAWVQAQPFFIWWGPHIPHDGPKPETYLEALVDPGGLIERGEREHYARVSWLDAGYTALEYHLRRACTCTAPGQARSLWDNTTVLFLADQGFLLPGAKGQPSESTQRTPLIVSAPEHRQPSTPPNWTPQVRWDLVPSAIDLLPTILRLAGDATGPVVYFAGVPNAAEYPLARDLVDWIDADGPSAPGNAARKLSYGSEMSSSGEGDISQDGGYPRHAVTSPGVLGVCDAPYQYAGTTDCETAGAACHVYPCLGDADCQAAGLGACRRPGGPGAAWGRCVNRPWVACEPGATGPNAGDATCAPASWCDEAAGQCVRPPDPADPQAPGDRDWVGFYRDFAGQPCTKDVDCVPAGVCRPLVLKWQMTSHQVVDDPGHEPWKHAAVYDLDWDPDETTDLFRDGTFMQQGSPSLAAKLEQCVHDFMKLHPTTLIWDHAMSTCDAALRDW